MSEAVAENLDSFTSHLQPQDRPVVDMISIAILKSFAGDQGDLVFQLCDRDPRRTSEVIAAAMAVALKSFQMSIEAAKEKSGRST